MGPVISKSAFDRVEKYVQDAHNDPKVTVLAGGKCDCSVGFFIRPTVVETTDPQSRFMKEEIFGPFMCLYTYDDAKFGPEIFELIDNTTDYALTGAIFSKDRQAINDAVDGLRFAAGNFYIK
jgi:1-pyrroline-5-carboxylate dehydrogenase